jgi:hypothetical protein
MERRYNLKSNHIIVSYPRSGSNYFQLAWKEKNDEYIRCIRTYDMVEPIIKNSSLIIIGLIRNPIDSITSRVLIHKTHEKFFKNEQSEIDFALSEYIKMYQFILDRADFIVDISSFDQIDKVIETISNSEQTIVNKNNIDDGLNGIQNYSPSFIGHEDYERVRNVIKKCDLEVHNTLYNLAYKKRLMV